MNTNNSVYSFMIPNPNATATEARDAAYLFLDMAKTSIQTLILDNATHKPNAPESAFAMTSECVMGCVYSVDMYLGHIQQAIDAILKTQEADK